MSQDNGIVGTIQKNFDSFKKPSSWYVEIAGYLIAGFIFGFLVKHGGRFFFWLVLGAALSLWALETFHVITIDYGVLKSIFGLSAQTTMADLSHNWTGWIKTHVLECLAALFGFVLAWKFA